MHTLFRAVGSTSNIAWVMLLQARRFGNLLLTQLASGGSGVQKRGRGSHTMRQCGLTWRRHSTEERVRQGRAARQTWMH